MRSTIVRLALDELYTALKDRAWPGIAGQVTKKGGGK